MQSGVVFEIQHFSVHDGPGIRTTVFLKGCQLHCLWCHNPESIPVRAGELAFTETRCVGCRQCFQICPQRVHQIEHGVHILHRENCRLCGKCVQHCSGGALSISGKEMSAEDVISELRKDTAYYRKSGGGVTFSGGEPMLQRDFIKELLLMCREESFSTALETNLCYPYDWLEGIRENIDYFLADWKESDSSQHKAWTGKGNEQILANLRRLCQDGHTVLLRCPIIPGYNDRPDHFKTIANLTRELPLLGAELLPYHSMGVGKIKRFGLEGQLKYIHLQDPDKDTADRWLEQCLTYGGNMINQRR